MLIEAKESRSSGGRRATEIGRRSWPRYDQRWWINGTKNNHFLNDWFSRICLISDHIRLALKLIEQALTQVTIERDVINDVVMFFLTRRVEVFVADRKRMDTDNNANSLVVMHMVQMNIRVQLGKPHHLNSKEAGKPPASRQRPHCSKQLYHNSQIKSFFDAGQGYSDLSASDRRCLEHGYLLDTSNRHQAYNAS